MAWDGLEWCKMKYRLTLNQPKATSFFCHKIGTCWRDTRSRLFNIAIYHVHNIVYNTETAKHPFHSSCFPAAR